MKLTFRWYGESDPVTLDKIRQIPTMSGVVSAVYDTPAGEVWSEKSILKIKNSAAENGLEFEVVESVPVHEEIKLGSDKAPKLIENYCENIRRLGKNGVKVICYNFMPVFDWLRSELERTLPDGSNALAYDEETLLGYDPANGGLSLPGWDESYSVDGLKELLAKYKNITEEKLFENLVAFLKAAVPAAEEAGVRLAIHPDDPPWGIFGLPRIITGKENIKRMLNAVKSPSNGLTLCTGSLGASGDNDMVALAAEFAKDIPFLHLRNIKINGYRRFEESAHPSQCGSLDMYGIVKALVDNGFDGYVRPDHGRMIWGETGRYGYGLYDRALGAAYISGLFEAAERNK